jgi:ABC-type branched-subunit amino acid transport system substrate-binding protein
VSLRRPLALGSVALCACSLIVNTTGVQCRTNADCAVFDAAGPIVCYQSVCVGPGVGPPCSTNAECMMRNGNAPAICRKDNHQCVALLSKECVKVYGDPSNDDAIVLGAMFTLSGVNMSSGTARMQSVELAADDFAQTVVGLPGGTGGKPRPLVFVECDDGSDSTQATNAANHLITVGVPAIIGPGGSGLVTAVVKNATIPKGVYVITPSATSTSLSGLDPLLWRTAPSDTVQAIAMQDQATAVEALFKTQNPTITKQKLAIAYQNNAYGMGLYDALSKTVTLNALPLGDAMNNGFFFPLSYDATALDPTSAEMAVVSNVVNIIIGVGTTEIITKFLTPAETAWPSASPRPLYLFSDAGEKPELLTAVMGNDALRVRIRGTVPGTTNPLYTAFALQYQGKYSATPSTFGTAGAYDSVYVLAYTIVSLGGAQVTGAAISGAMAKIVGGQAAPVGAANIKSAFQTLQGGSAVQIGGASGPLHFDLNLHEAKSDITVWCISKDGTGNPIFAASGRYYDAPTDQMKGTYSCP